MVLSKESVESLEKELDTNERLWADTITKYYGAYSEEKINGTYSENSNMSGEFWEKLVDLQGELENIQSKLKNHIKTAEGNISNFGVRLNEISYGKSNSIKEAKEYIAKNKSSSTRQIDKLDEKSRAYLTTTFYSVSLITMSFFIYKQLKQ